MLCDFQPLSDPRTFRCSRCGRRIRVRSSAAAGHVRAECQVVDLGKARRLPCAYLGPQLGTEPCGACRGRVTLKVFECLHENHERTTLPGCASCPDYTPGEALSGERRRLLLRFPHGFGDAVQLTTVLLHLRALYPRWSVDVATKRGAHTLFSGLCRGAYLLKDEPAGENYDIRRTLWWHEPDACYADSPSTKAEKCLREVFRIEPRPRLCRYVIHPDEDAKARAREYVLELMRQCGRRVRDSNPRFPFVLIHYQGNSARANKNLDERAVRALCEEVLRSGCTPVILDWDNRSGLADQRRVFCPGAAHPVWRGGGSGDGATLAALAELAAWCVGIDSGPGHVFGATDTPTLLVWTRHHPIHYYGLADNVTHLVPVWHSKFIRGDEQTGLRYFEENYRHRLYWRLGESLVRLAAEFCKANDGNLLTVDGEHWVRRRHRRADMVIVRDVYLEDCYRVAELPRPPRYVVDVGAHIGAFAMRLRQRTSRAKIVCVEANPANLESLRANVSDFAHVVTAACTYEPGPLELLSTVFAGSDNTGGSTVLPRDDPRRKKKAASAKYRACGETPGVTLEEIMRRFQFPRIDLLKLDCEGSEISILDNCGLESIGHVVGEFHNRRLFRELIERRFQGWNVRILRDDEPGLFWLWK